MNTQELANVMGEMKACNWQIWPDESAAWERLLINHTVRAAMDAIEYLTRSSDYDGDRPSKARMATILIRAERGELGRHEQPTSCAACRLGIVISAGAYITSEDGVECLPGEPHPRTGAMRVLTTACECPAGKMLRPETTALERAAVRWVRDSHADALSYAVECGQRWKDSGAWTDFHVRKNVEGDGPTMHAVTAHYAHHISRESRGLAPQRLTPQDKADALRAAHGADLAAKAGGEQKKLERLPF